MAKNKNIIRVGDKVKIINPVFFLECNYERNIKVIKEEIYGNPEEMRKIREFLFNMSGAGKDELLVMQGDPPHFRSALDHIVHGVAYDRIDRKKGNRRILFTNENPFYEGFIMEVTRIYFCKTGTYLPSQFYYSFDGEADYEPAYLQNEKTHKILSLEYGSLEIESIHVEKVRKEEPSCSKG